MTTLRARIRLLVSGVAAACSIAAASPGTSHAQGPLPVSQLLGAAAADAHVLRWVLDGAGEGADDPADWDRVHTFYRARGFQPSWLGPDRRAAARVFASAMSRAAEHGLRPSVYRGLAWEQFWGDPNAPRPRADRIASDVHFTADLIRFATHVAVGSPAASARAIDIAALIADAEDAAAARDVLASLPPVHEDYHRLQRALRWYRQLDAAGGWRHVPDDVFLGSEVTDAAAAELPDARGIYYRRQRAAVRAVCQRLAVTGDLHPALCRPPPSRYTQAIAAGVRAFQTRLGLVVDGIVGPNTAAAMNVPVSQRIEQIEANLERWRHLPDTLGDRHVFVNVPAFRLEARSGGATVLGMRVVAGEPDTPTPVFSDEISYLEFRPYWNVPRSITVSELVPRLARDPGYRSRLGFEVVDGWDEPANVVPPAAVDWTTDPGEFPYRLRQRPGPANSLGLVKFMFPNRYNVYLHDTPATHRFDARHRAFSHGCVRVEDPVALAVFLLDDPLRWDRASVRGAMHGTSRQVITLPREVPVHLTYFTAWFDGETVHFRADLYGLDAAAACRLPRCS